MHLLVNYALRFVGTPYKWGGSNPIEGMDCSGFVQELLMSAGVDPKGDQTAQGLFDYFSKTGDWNKYLAGSLAFFGESVTKITHVGFCLDEYRMIEAGGGDHLTLTPLDAAKKNAFIRVRLINSRKDLVAVIRPRYEKIGVI